MHENFAEVLKILAQNQVSVEYAYAFVSREQNNAYVILRVGDNKHAQDILAQHGVEMPASGSMFGG